jgi:hypothetical protein
MFHSWVSRMSRSFTEPQSASSRPPMGSASRSGSLRKAVATSAGAGSRSTLPPTVPVRRWRTTPRTFSRSPVCTKRVSIP